MSEKSWKYGLGEDDRMVGIMEAAMRVFNERTKSTMASLARNEAIEMADICAEGVKSFENASVGICPLQRVITGVLYTLNALEEWREKGPMHGV